MTDDSILTPAVINGIAARTVPVAAELVAALIPVFHEHGITTRLRLCHFLAQASHETGGFKWFTELGGQGYFLKYDGRKDLGNMQPGDGYKFRGRGIFQLTGRTNYHRYGDLLDLDLIGNPDLASRPDVACQLAGSYWAARGLNAAADHDDIAAITHSINGGLNGLDDRKAALARAKVLIKGDLT